MSSFEQNFDDSFDHQTNESAGNSLRFFLGCAVINLDQVKIEEPHDYVGMRHFNPHRVDRLRKIFEIEGCCNLEPENKVVATVDPSTFANALSSTEVAEEQLLDQVSQVHLKLNENARLICIHGRHRLRAAREFGENCWLVDVYRDDLPDKTRTQLCDKSSKILKLSDGDIYRKYRIYKNAQDELQAAEWWAKLSSERRRKWFKLLEKKPDLFNGFERLLQYPGFWKILNTRQIERMIKLNCPEIILQYLRDIYNKWQSIVGPLMANMVDNSSVSSIEGMIPSNSLHDRTQIAQLMETRNLFPYVKDSSERLCLKTRILAVRGRITSFNTLAQDILYFEHPTMALHHLCHGRKDLTLIAQMRRQWNSANKQEAPQLHIPGLLFKTVPNSRNSFTNSMVQLWLFTLRHFVYDPPKVTTSREYDTPHQILTFQALALLAQRLGFSSDLIEKILNKCQSSLTARNSVHRISGDEYMKAVANNVASLTTDSPDQKSQRIFGRPVASQYREQRGNLFIEQIFGPAETVAEYPTSLAITRDILICFFGQEAVDEIIPRVRVTSFSGESMSCQIDANLPSAAAVEGDTAHIETHGDECEIHDQKAPDEFETARKIPSCPGEESVQSGSESISAHPIDTADHMAWRHTVFMAAGFEDELTMGDMEVKLYVTHHGRFPEILNTWRRSSKQNLVVVYLFEDRVFYKFRATDNFSLRSFLKNLARDFILMEIHANYELSIPKSWGESLANHLIVACRKDSPARKKPLSAEMSMDEFRNYIRNYDIQTGKRYSEECIARFARRRCTKAKR